MSYLFLVVDVDNRCILSAPVIALSIKSCRVMELEEVLHQLLIGFILTIILEVIYFYMLRGTCANLHSLHKHCIWRERTYLPEHKLDLL